jgi:hypothetical protein
MTALVLRPEHAARAMLARAMNRVIGVDVNPALVATINTVVRRFTSRVCRRRSVKPDFACLLPVTSNSSARPSRPERAVP